LLVPAGISLAVKTLHPVPSRIDLILALRSATDAATAERSKLLAAYYEDHPEFAPAGQAAGAAEDANAIRVVSAAKIERDLAPVLAGYQSQLARQQSLVEKLSFLSPALLAQSALADAAGTGSARHHAFLRQAVAHHAELRAFFNPRILRKEKFTAWDDVPPFRYVEESARAVALRVAPALLGLLLAATALTVWAASTLRRTAI
jgi:ABC-2 type transport system permease protein